ASCTTAGIRPFPLAKSNWERSTVIFLLPSWEKVGAEGARMRGLCPHARRWRMRQAAASSVSLREPPSPTRGEGNRWSSYPHLHALRIQVTLEFRDRDRA